MNNPSAPSSPIQGTTGMTVNFVQAQANGGGPLVNPIGAQPSINGALVGTSVSYNPTGGAMMLVSGGGGFIPGIIAALLGYIGGMGVGPNQQHSGIGGGGAQPYLNSCMNYRQLNSYIDYDSQTTSPNPTIPLPKQLGPRASPPIGTPGSPPDTTCLPCAQAQAQAAAMAAAGAGAGGALSGGGSGGDGGTSAGSGGGTSSGAAGGGSLSGGGFEDAGVRAL